MRNICLLLTLLLVLITSGCGDLLDQEPKAILTASTAFQTPNDIKKALMATYHSTQIELAQRSMFAFGDICSDDALKGGEGGGDQAAILKLEYFTANPNNSYLQPVWKFAYQGIHRANLVIKNANNIDGLTKAKANRYVAEAKFLRAFFYYRLVKVYGGVPLVKQANLKNYELPRSSKDSTYALIEADLKDAAKVLLPKNKIALDQLGRATKGAAQALLARVFLMQGNFQQAEDWARKIIDSGQYSLDPNFQHVFTIEGEHGPGNIFEIDYDYDNSYQFQSYGTVVDFYKGSRAFYGYGFDLPTQDLHDAFEVGDPRLKATMFANGDTLPDGKIGDVGNSPSGYVGMKAYLPKDVIPPNFHDSPKDKIILRLGEVLLWYAEAANENGNTQQALDALNKVRARARNGDPTILPDVTVTDKSTLREKIYHEERVEYAIEGKHFYDLVRTGRAAEVLHAFAKKYDTKKGANYTKGKNNVFPIPQTQIDVSQGTLEQNPGY